MKADDGFTPSREPEGSFSVSESEPEFTDPHFGEDSLLLKYVEESRAEYAAGNYLSLEQLAAELGVELEGPA